MKKIVFRFLPLLLISALLLTGGIFLSVRQDITFRLYQQIASLFQSSDCVEAEVQTEKVSIEKLCKKSNIQILINTEHPIPEYLSLHLTEIDGVLISTRLLDSFQELKLAISDRYDKALCIRSGYRTKDEQKQLYETMSSELAAPVGASEHELGLALDVYIEGSTGGEILKTSAGRYLHRHAYEFGFIIRYPYGKSEITGITYEPWHIRYVGKPHAEIIYRESLTLEEYLFEFLTPNVYYQIGNYLISRQIADDDQISLPITCTSLEISDDNCGGYLITAKLSSLNQ